MGYGLSSEKNLYNRAALEFISNADFFLKILAKCKKMLCGSLCLNGSVYSSGMAMSLWWLIFCPHRTCFGYISRYTVILNTTVLLVLVILDGKINIDDKRQWSGFTPMLFIERTQWISLFSLKYPKRTKPIFLNVCLCLANRFCSLISRGKVCPYVIIHF